MRGVACLYSRAVAQPRIFEERIHSDGGRREIDETRRPEAIVPVDVPFIAQRARRELDRLSGLQIRDVCVGPEQQLRIVGRNADRIGAI